MWEKSSTDKEVQDRRSGVSLCALRAMAVHGPSGLVANVTETKGASDAARAFFEKKCSICHLLDRPLKKRQDRKGRTDTVGRMKERSGQWISEDDAKAIVEYLSTIRGQ